MKTETYDLLYQSIVRDVNSSSSFGHHREERLISGDGVDRDKGRRYGAGAIQHALDDLLTLGHKYTVLLQRFTLERPIGRQARIILTPYSDKSRSEISGSLHTIFLDSALIHYGKRRPSRRTTGRPLEYRRTRIGPTTSSTASFPRRYEHLSAGTGSRCPVFGTHRASTYLYQTLDPSNPPACTRSWRIY